MVWHLWPVWEGANNERWAAGEGPGSPENLNQTDYGASTIVCVPVVSF